MNHSTIKKYIPILPKQIQNKVGKKLGSGLEGVVYSYGKNKIIKIATARAAIKGDGWNLKQSINVIEHLKQDVPSHIIKIGKYGILSEKDEVYYYTSDRLEKLTRGEELFIDDALVSDYDISLKYISQRRATKYNKLLKFLESLTSLYCDRSFKFDISDIHTGNIMKTKSGEYKLVDFGYVELKRKWK